MPRKPQEVESKLENKFGFQRSQTHSADHKWFELKVEGIRTIITKVSHGKREIDKSLEGKMAQQLGVTRQFFVGMIDCMNSREDYINEIRMNPRGVLLRNPARP